MCKKRKGNLIINKEIRDLIRPLTKEEFAQLEESILKNGILNPIIVDRKSGIIVDGHHRYKIAQKHNIPYNITEKKFDSKTDIKLWMLKNSVAQRNLNNYERAIIALKLKDEYADAAKKRKLSYLKQNLKNKSEKQNPTDYKNQKGKTREKLSKIAGISEATLGRVNFIEKHASKKQKQDLIEGTKTINRVFTSIKQGKLIKKVENDNLKKTRLELIETFKDSSLPHSKKIYKRLCVLNELTEESYPDDELISVTSLKGLRKFLTVVTTYEYPDITITPEGNISLHWTNDREEKKMSMSIVIVSEHKFKGVVV
jgi:hypothetical protein